VAKVKAGDYAIPEHVPSLLQDLIRQILTVDVTKRITISQIKAHPAFRMFLPAKYIVPAPLLTPRLLDPIGFDDVDDDILAILRSIGYADDATIRRGLEPHDTSMAKVFFNMCLRNQTVENLPWPSGDDTGNGAELDSAFLMPPQTIATEGIAPNPLVRKRSLGISSLGSSKNSLAAHADWGDSPAPVIEAEEELAFTDIAIALPDMMTELQVFLREMAIDWFHPNDQELIGRTADRAMYVGLEVTISGTDQVDIHVWMLRGNAQIFGQFVDGITRLVERLLD
jgi:BR serine/threonine kinase